MTWCADQLPEIARRVLAEEQDGRPPDLYRKAWAEQVLQFSRPGLPEEQSTQEAGVCPASST